MMFRMFQYLQLVSNPTFHLGINFNFWPKQWLITSAVLRLLLTHENCNCAMLHVCLLKTRFRFGVVAPAVIQRNVWTLRSFHTLRLFVWRATLNCMLQYKLTPCMFALRVRVVSSCLRPLAQIWLHLALPYQQHNVPLACSSGWAWLIPIPYASLSYY